MQKSDLSSTKNKKKGINTSKSGNKGLKRILIITISLFILVLVLLFLFRGHILLGNTLNKTDDITDYGNFQGFLGYSDLSIFPEKLLETSEEVEYYYYNRDTLFDPTCQVYLKCKYEANEFEREIKRLSTISITNDKGEKNQIIFDQERFDYDTYVAMYNWSSCYEYAIINPDNKTIVYIFTQGIHKNRVKFDKKYLPFDFMEDTTYDGDSYDNYSIYSFNGEFHLKYR